MFNHSFPVRKFSVKAFSITWIMSCCLITLVLTLVSCDGRPPSVYQFVWDFEDGLQDWVPSGAAFEGQPIEGQTVTASRGASPEVVAQLDSIGGNYWDVPYPIGIQGRMWIGSFEKERGNEANGILVSPEFNLERRYIDFLIGGGCDPRTVGLKVELQAEDGSWSGAASATGTCEDRRPIERMERQVLDLESHVGARARIVIFDNSASGHINVDDVRVSSVPAEPEPEVVWGLADTHAHAMAHLAYDGNLIWGEPTGTLTTETQRDHGENGARLAAVLIHELEEEMSSAGGGGGFDFPPELVELLADIGAGGILDLTEFTSHSRTQGVPPLTYIDWRNRTHQQMHVDWIRRAYEGGLRLLVTEAVNSRLLAFSTHNPVRDPDKDTDSYIDQIHEMEDLVAANSDWMEIAYTPGDARRIIQDENKLAIVLGIEVDSFGDCDRVSRSNTAVGGYYYADTRQCNIEDVRRALETVYNLGVRQLHIVHITDNAFAGAAVYNGFFNTSNFYVNGEFFDVRDGWNSGVSFRFDSTSFAPAFNVFMPYPKPVPSPPSYAVFRSHVNARGLESLGRQLVLLMQERGMIIAADHMSELALDQTLGLTNTVTGERSPGVVGPVEKCLSIENEKLRTACLELDLKPVALTHTGFRELDGNEKVSEIMKRSDQIERVFLTGGTVSPGIAAAGSMEAAAVAGIDAARVENSCNGTSRSFAQQLQYLEHLWEGLGFDVMNLGIPLGTDLNGMNGSVAPRFGQFACGGENFGQASAQLNGNAVLYEHYRLGSLPAGVPSNFGDAAPLNASGFAGSPRRFDINVDGVAHYGMLPDFLQDLRTVGVEPDQLQYLFLGAESYIRMWEKACLKSNRQLSGEGCE